MLGYFTEFQEGFMCVLVSEVADRETNEGHLKQVLELEDLFPYFQALVGLQDRF